MEEQEKQEEVKNEVSESEAPEVKEEEEVKEDRPEVNYQAELARKNAELARLRAEVAEKQSPPKRDPADITTWTDNELKMLRNSNDPSVAQYKEQADEILLERKVKAIQAREYENRRREESKAELERQYPESADPSSEFSLKLEKVMRDYDLSRTPSGRLVAAKIVAAEGKTSKELAQKKESNRVNRVKNQMVDGDRPKPTESNKDLDSKKKELTDKLTSGKESQQVEAISDYLKSRRMTQDEFFKR